MSHDPFKITGQTAISFSGGRTSAYMLWRVLQANGGVLPDGVEVCFANTGKEMEETLEFVRDVALNWNVPIRWIEFRDDEAGFAMVNFATASRNGEPFAALIAKRQYLPNPVTRFCTVELKIRAMHRHLKSLGWKDGDGWDQMVGIRADEPRRVAKIRARPSPETSKETMILPLADAGVTKKDVGDFWRAQPFDLKLYNNNGVTMHGNCDLCLAGETEVVTDQGIKTIRELAGTTPNLLVPKMAFGMLSEVGSFKAAPVQSFGVQRLWKITLAGHGRSQKTVFATAEHRWFLTRKVARGSIPVEATPTSALKPGDKLRNLYRVPIGTERGNSSKISALRGFVFGDGTVPSGDRPALVHIHEGKDEVFRPFFEMLCGKGAESIQASSPTGRKNWIYYGLPRYWKTEFPPLHESRHYLMGWLAGWFAADGCVDENGVCILNSAKREHLQFACSVCAILGIQHSPIRSQVRDAALPGGNVLKSHKIFAINLNRSHLTSDFFWLKQHSDRIIKNESKEKRRYGWTVVSVEPTDRIEEVFCATVDGVGAFGLADGLMTGNCFLKGPKQVFSLIREKPSRAIWWAAQESLSLSSKPSGASFRNDRPSYQRMMDYAEHQDDMFGDADEEAIACFCGD